MSEENKKTAPMKSTTEAVKKEEGKLPFGQRVKKWFREMKSELKKVIWPTPKQVLNNTGVALLMMAACAVVLWLFDQTATMAVRAIINLVG